MHEFDRIALATFRVDGSSCGATNRYFRALIDSFEVMKGMEKDQFLKFRMALLPASGFQSVQYRKSSQCHRFESHDKNHRTENPAEAAGR